MTVCKNLLYEKISRHTVISLAVSALVTVILIFIPTGFEGIVQFKDEDKCRVKIESVDNSR